MASAAPFFSLMGGSSPAPSVATIAGRLRAVERRFRNDAGWFPWRGVSDLEAAGDWIHGRADEVRVRFGKYAAGGRTVVRVLGMLGEVPWVNAGLDFSPRTPGYQTMREELVACANGLGLYVEWCLFADAQIVMPSASERTDCVMEFAAFCSQHPGVVPQLVNEPFKNGWQSAVDPALLELARLFASLVGHKDFSIGDPGDTDTEPGAEMVAAFKTLSQYSNIMVWHPDRGFSLADARWRRWLDHLEGVTAFIGDLAPGVAFVIDEPIGAAPTLQPGRRDSDPDAFVAAQFIAACCGLGFTYHKINAEIAVDDLPGFAVAADVLARVPASPDWRYLNDSWPGAPTEGITWSGKEGKMRHLVNGDRTWSVAYAEGDWGSVRWRAGWTPTVAHAGQRLRVWSVTR